jgi:hypothetical protein
LLVKSRARDHQDLPNARCTSNNHHCLSKAEREIIKTFNPTISCISTNHHCFKGLRVTILSLSSRSHFFPPQLTESLFLALQRRVTILYDSVPGVTFLHLSSHPTSFAQARRDNPLTHSTQLCGHALPNIIYSSTVKLRILLALTAARWDCSPPHFLHKPGEIAFSRINLSSVGLLSPTLFHLNGEIALSRTSLSSAELPRTRTKRLVSLVLTSAW